MLSGDSAFDLEECCRFSSVDLPSAIKELSIIVHFLKIIMFRVQVNVGTIYEIWLKARTIVEDLRIGEKERGPFFWLFIC